MTIAAKDIEAADLPDNLQKRDYSPYHFFTAEEWSRFRADTPMTLTADEVQRLRSLNDPVDLGEVRQIYLSLSRLLSTHVESSQMLFEQRKRFLSMSETKTPSSSALPDRSPSASRRRPVSWRSFWRVGRRARRSTW